MALLRIPLLIALALGTPEADAYESDPLSVRQDPPEDGTALANQHADALLQDALAQVNRMTECFGDDASIHVVTAKEIFRTMGAKTTVPARGRQPAMWFGAYAAWLESGPVDRRDNRQRTDLYSDVRLTNSPILKVFGPSSIVRLADVLLGTDKVDHFWVQGFDYYRVSRDGADPARAVRWGTRTELGIWGEATTGVFSYADLAANYDGFRFYAGLLQPGSIVQRDTRGCVVQVRPFDWRDWIDWHYDEALNPSVYTPGIAADVGRWTSSAGTEICSDDETWRLEWARQAATPHVERAYTSTRAPTREASTDLADLCPALALALPVDADAPIAEGRASRVVAREARAKPVGL